MSKVYTVTFGGWYQRTTLHLSEIFEFLSVANSYLDLSQEKLLYLHKNLNLQEVSRETDYLEYVRAKTTDGIEIRYFEDGLYILEFKTENIQETKLILEKYFNDAFLPAMDYIFSLGAPTPKVLANIKNSHPVVVSFSDKDFDKFEVAPEKFGKVYSKISSRDMCVYKTKDYIFVVAKTNDGDSIKKVIETQIFFREFKDQLEKYLFIHRKIWFDIDQVKEMGQMKYKDIPKIRSKLDDYKKTISLINNRIAQMDSYAKTRQSIAQRFQIENHLLMLFQYRFESLLNTLDYIKEIWKMTLDYVNLAIDTVLGLQSSNTGRSIQSLTLITTMGVVSGLLTYLTRDKLPAFTFIGALYLITLLSCGYLINFVLQKISQNKKGKLKFSSINKSI
ncbi:hypothetical protein L6255_03005 [Candidatus Parcubacteria bacterium]|nr:hypothetical protein [Patescibacteria group bacterium]MBU4380969.1 hypothetical protein [Patescibacteria group bacterium]MCG2689382.1 hypothetical protein [Candidatus Parcubacteria bacterium]